MLDVFLAASSKQFLTSCTAIIQLAVMAVPRDTYIF